MSVLPVLLVGAALAQEPGEVVAAVELDAPEAVARRLRRYVDLSPGEVLDHEDLGRSVRLLFATGEFADVLVERERAPQGLRLRFRLVPSPRLSAVRVEGDRTLSAARVSRLARLVGGEPLWPHRLEAAARQVALALGAQGFLEAQVAAEARPGLRGTDAVLRVRAGPRVRVSRAAVVGVTAAEQEPLLRLARPAAGAVFVREEARRSAEAMRRRLVQAGHWAARVVPQESYDPRSARLALDFEVAPGPRYRVAYRGDPLPSGLRRGIERLLREGGAGADAREEARERVERHLQRRGHRQATASLREEPGPAGGASLVVEVAAGPVARVGTLRVVGSPEPALEASVRLVPRAPLEDAVLAEEAASLTRALVERGYAEARVEADAPEGGGDVPVAFRVSAGPLVSLAAVGVEAPPLPEDVRLPAVALAAGQPYRLADVAQARQALLSAFRDAGYPDVAVEPRVSFAEDPSRASVVFQVTPGRRVEIRHIVVSGLRDTREEVVRRELRVREGGPLSLDGLLESQRRLAGLPALRRVSVTEVGESDPARRSLVVAAEEAPRTSLAYGLGYAERDLLRLSAEVTRRNLFGLDRSVASFMRFSVRGNRALATYREPYLLGRRQQLFVTAFREEEDREFFDFVRYGGSAQTVRDLGHGLSLIARYTYQLTRSFNIEDPTQVAREFAASALSGPSLSLVRDSRDDPLDPRGGSFLSADVQLSHRLLGGDSFARGYLQAAAYRPLGPRLVLAATARVGLARTFGTEESLFLPLADRFYAGGDYSLRGFKTDAVRPPGGNALLLGGAELRVAAGRHLAAAAFADAGNVFPLASEIELGRLRYSAGVGLRYRSAFGPVRLDWGFKLDRRPGEPSSRLHFTIGHAF
jgi:outer membrane protein assembly complex protein YaeT